MHVFVIVAIRTLSVSISTSDMTGRNDLLETTQIRLSSGPSVSAICYKNLGMVHGCVTLVVF